ncbi:GTP-binding protein ERG-like [Rosa chinensis]|uniref:GTP-binding protein ERG-like n=1 Tax=Rosa chinensis TaxID=74649 RepID=UPI000D0951DA|nr:GTP-binding protein ERG-like [Rosa chinensis]
MKSLRALRLLSSKPANTTPSPTFLLLCRSFYATQPEQSDPTHTPSSSEFDAENSFDSTLYELPIAASDSKPQNPIWDEKYRSKADRLVNADETHKAKLRFLKEEEDERKRRLLAKALLEAALERGDEEESDGEEEVVKEEDQKSLTVGIIAGLPMPKSLR